MDNELVNMLAENLMRIDVAFETGIYLCEIEPVSTQRALY
jgi:hypothetical protein